MAVVLVKSCCKPFGWAVDACNACGEGCLDCVSETCRVCGGACDSCCRFCGTSCTKCCGCCAEGCDGLMNWADSFCSEPFAGCVVFAVLLNLATFLAAVYYVSRYFDNTCENPLHVWIIVALVLFLVNTAFGIYLFVRLSRSIVDVTTHDPRRSQFSNKWHQSWQFFMYDPVVALYILVYLFCIVWGILGIVWAWNPGRTCEPELIAISRGGGLTLLVFVFVSMMCLVCGLFSGWCNEMLDGCSFFKCVCCCIYYPCCYEADRRRQTQRRAQQQGRPDQKEAVAPVVVVGSPPHHAVPPSAPYHQAYTAPSYPHPISQPYQAAPLVAQPVYMHPQQQPYQLQSQYQAPPIATAVRLPGDTDIEQGRGLGGSTEDEGERLHLLGSRT